MFTAGVIQQQRSNDPLFVTQEWFIFKTNTSHQLLYKSVNLDTGVVSDIATLTSNSALCVQTDGKFVFTNSGDWSGTGYIKRQHSYNSGTFTQRLSTHIVGATNVQSNMGITYLPTNPGRLLITGGNGEGLGVFTYQSAPTYSWGTCTFTTTAADAWIAARDVRVAAPNTPVIGDTVVTFPNTSSNQHQNSYTISGATFTKHGGDTSISTYAYGGAGGVCRDTGQIANVASASQSVLLHQLSMSTRQISVIGTSSAMGVNVACCGWTKGFLIVLHTNGSLRSYSRSGTTLSLITTINFGGSATTNGQIMVSPYSRAVYVTANGSTRIVTVADNGTMTHVASTTSMYGSSGAGPIVAFLPTPLENT